MLEVGPGSLLLEECFQFCPHHLCGADVMLGGKGVESEIGTPGGRVDRQTLWNIHDFSFFHT